MATREIKTKISIDGEAELKKQLKDISSNMGVLRSEMAATSAKFAEQQNSYEALASKGNILEKQLGAQAEKYEALKGALEKAEAVKAKYAEALEKEKSALESIEGTDKNAEAAKAAHRKEIEQLERVLAAAAEQTQKYQKEVNYAGAAVDKANSAYEQNKRYLEEARASADRTASSINELGKEARNASGEFDQLGKSSVDSLSTAADLFMASKAAGLAKDMAGAIIDLSDEFSNASANIGKATGATGAELESLAGIASRVFAQVPESLDEVSKVLGTLSTATGLTGGELESLTRLTMDYARVNNEGAATSAASLGRLMNALGADANELGTAMDMLTKSSQMSGIGVNELTKFIIDAGPSFGEMGFGLEKSIALFSQYYKAGANPAEITSTLNKALTQLAREGATDAEGAFSMLLERIKNAPDIMSATVIAADAFGARVGSKIAEDIRSGRFEVDEWVSALEKSQGTVTETAKATETASQQMATALNGVKAAFMEQLAPSVENFQSSLAGLAGEFAEFLRKNQAAVPIITSLAAGLGVLLAGITAYTLAKKLATAATLAFNGALLANPAGIVIVALAGLAAAAVTVRTAFSEAEEAADEFKESLEGIAASQKETESETMAAAAVAESYIEKLEELEGQLKSLESGTDEANAAQREYAATVELLNATIPGINATIDETTGLIAGGTRALWENTEAWKNNAQAQAMQEAASEYLAKLADAKVKQKIAENDLTEAKREQAEWQERLNDLEERHNEIQASRFDFDFSREDELEQLESELEAVRAKTGELNDTVLDLESYLAIATERVEAADEAYGLYAETIEGLIERQGDFNGIADDTVPTADEIAEAIESLSEAVSEATSGIGELAGDLDMLSAALDEQADAGGLSVNSILRLIDAGYAAALAIDAETGAVYLNEAALRDMVMAKIADEKASLAVIEASAKAAYRLANEAGDALAAAAAYRELAAAKAAAAALEGIEANIGEGSFTIPKSSGGGGGGGGGSSKGGGGGGKSKAGTPQKKEDPYKEERELLDYHYKMGEISQQEYYDSLEKMRDKYFEKNTAEWRKANLELFNLAEKIAKDLEKEKKEQLEKRKKQIKEELDLEKQRINAIIDGINAEIAARKRLKEDSSADQKVKDAERALAAARAELDFARDEESRAQAEKLVIQREIDLKNAKDDFEDYEWNKAQQDKINALKAQMKEAEKEADRKIEGLTESSAAEIAAAVAEAIAIASQVAVKAAGAAGTASSSAVTNTANVNVTYTQAAATTAQVTTIVNRTLEGMI